MGLLLFVTLLPARSVALQDGEIAPKATLMTASGEKIDLATYAKKQKKKNLLLLFFRTGTCNVCIQQLLDVASRVSEIEKWKTAVLAISLDDAIVQKRTSEKIEGKIPILLDPDAKTVHAYHVYNPDDKLARPSIFLLGPDRKILYHYVGQGISDRPPTATVMHAVEHYSGLPPRSTAAK